jgi:1-acyl-sn-glycerol-3-phosphate acyltransferase
MPQIWPRFRSVFTVCTGYCLRRHFESLRILRNGLPSPIQPAVVFLNHASWWDPLVCLLLSRKFFAGRDSFAPIDAAMLKRYQFFKRLGFFGLNPGSALGAVTFARTAAAILASPKNLLWLTPQGRFADARERPAELRSGIGLIASRSVATAFLPLAIEYTFWRKSRPEILVSFGEPILAGSFARQTAKQWTNTFSRSLEVTQDKLAAAVKQRDDNDWIILEHRSPKIASRFECLANGQKTASIIRHLGPQVEWVR